MEIQDHYRWEAEKGDGAIVTTGGDLAGCVRFSLLPQISGLPRHDVINVPMVNRFGRGFIRAMGGGYKEYLHCVVGVGWRFYVSSATGQGIITPEDFEMYV